MTNLEESLEPPHLENTLADQHSQLEDTPPLHPGVGALGRVPVNPLSHNNVRLLILNLCQSLRELADYDAEKQQRLAQTAAEDLYKR